MPSDGIHSLTIKTLCLSLFKEKHNCNLDARYDANHCIDSTDKHFWCLILMDIVNSKQRNRDGARRQLHESTLVTTQRHQRCILVITKLILASQSRWRHITPTDLCVAHPTITIHSIVKEHVLVLGDPYFILMRSR